jgi:unsaturated rhamnogalacturonyl hydrolase
VLDDRSSYAESSATSMVAYGLLKLVRLGVLPKSYRALAQRAWSAVTERYIQDGIVVGVSAGTSPSGGDHYRSRPQGTQSWGTGACLMAGSEIHRLAR